MESKRKVWNNMRNQFSLSKTLRFELRPVRNSYENMREIIVGDETRAEEYKIMKKIIDEFHKYFIEETLQKIEIDENNLKEIYELYKQLRKINKIDNEKELNDIKKEFIKVKEEILKNFSNKIEKDEKIYEKFEFKDLFDKELIKEIIPKFFGENFEKITKGLSKIKIIRNKEEFENIIENFKNWTTYFVGFNENRKNVYKKDIPTSIVYRCIEDNMLKFFDNILNYEKLKEKYGTTFYDKKIFEDLKEELQGKSLDEIFSIKNFNNCLNQKGISTLNTIIGGKTLENEEKKRQGLNEYINLFSQSKQDKNIKKLRMTILFKQILSDEESSSFSFEPIENDKVLVNNLSMFYKNLKDNVFEKLKKLFESIEYFDLDEIYLKNDSSLTDISQFLFSSYNFINEKIIEFKELKKGKKLTKSELKNLKNRKYIPLYEINGSLKDEEEKILEYLKEFQIKKNNTLVNIFSDIDLNYENIKRILEKKYNENDKNLINEEKDISKIKLFLDSIMGLFHFVKPLNIFLKEKEEKKQIYTKNVEFYSEFDILFENIREVNPLYNKVRNYLTQKSYSIEKYKLNFENSTLLNGWDLNKEKDNTSVLFKKDNLYYLGIMKKEHNKIFEKIENSNRNDFYEKIIYKQVSGASKMLPKVFISSKKWLEKNHIDKDFLNKYEKRSHTKGESFDINFCHNLIDYFKKCIFKHEWNEIYNFKFSDTKDYEDISEFYKEFEEQAYKITFQKIDSSHINELIDGGKLFLFQIYNKDFSQNKIKKENYNSNKNLHTIYWNMIFDKKNLGNVVIKLNGEAEIFFRKKSIREEDKTIHKKNENIPNKNLNNEKKESKFSYDIIKDKRYTQDKILFHCPITLNFKSSSRDSINKKINEIIKDDKNNEINILSIDRGERHLAYYTLLNQKGEILESGSFNKIRGFKNTEIDYREKLDRIEGNRGEARKNWKKIENIKELKEGYLSQVIYKICKLIIENNAIIVFEDLNFGFKRGRFKVEKQVYQKFEKMLIDKLNFLVFKNRKEDEIGGVLNAYQLTSKFKSFKKLGKQSGMIFYVNANYTSKICPKTGFVNLLYPYFENNTKSEEFFKKFNYIKYNKNEDLFEFNFNYSNFKKEINLEKDNWSVFSNGSRIKHFRNKDNNNQWEESEIDLTNELKTLLKENNVEYKDGRDIKEQLTKNLPSNFHKSLIYYLKLILQLRNSKINDDTDYILSCVKDENGNFFNSEKTKENLPKNADENGAYHIGEKGIMVINKIKKFEEDSKNNKYPDLRISNEEFFNEMIKRKSK